MLSCACSFSGSISAGCSTTTDLEQPKSKGTIALRSRQPRLTPADRVCTARSSCKQPCGCAALRDRQVAVRAPTQTQAVSRCSMTDPASLQHYNEVAVKAAQAAGAVIRAAIGKKKNVEHKGSVDLVTETDQQCEELVFQHIKDAFPDHLLIGEEGSAKQGFTSELTDAPTWMVDPLDGTTNFVHGYPFVCVAIGLAIKQQLVVGVVYNPIMEELFTAVRGKGAFLNGEQIRVSDQDSLGSALLATEIGVSRDAETVAAIFDRISSLTSKMRSVRCSGSCALNLCSVACGRLDAFYEIGFGGPWDVAGAALILEEAGGKVLDPAGGAFDVMGRRVLGTNAHLAGAVSEVLAACNASSLEPQPQRQ